MSLDLIQTLALAALVFGAGAGLKRIVPVLARLNIPAAVVGGFSYAVVMLVAESFIGRIVLDTSAQQLFMVAFFTSIGMGATWSLLQRGGLPVVILLSLATVLALVQNFAGIAAAWALGVHPLVGVIAGSVTLVGGPATGMAFAPSFEAAGVAGAGVLTIASATVGILCGGLGGGPIGSYLIRRWKLTTPDSSAKGRTSNPDSLVQFDGDQEQGPFALNLLLLGVCMGLGSLIGMGIAQIGWVLPGYIGAMVVASIVANVAERSSRRFIDVRLMRFIGGISLNIFLVVALMNLRLAELANLAVPLTLVLILQVVIAVLFTVLLVFRFMGRDYNGAVVSAGFLGFGLGTTANAVANMQTLESRFGEAPQAFLTVPIVGGFFIDFTNALVINLFLNWWR